MYKDFKDSKFFKEAIQSGIEILQNEERNLTFENINDYIKSEEKYIYYKDCENMLCNDDNNTVFEFIGMIQKYEQENFGALYTDLSNSFIVANTIHYLLWESLSYDIMSEFNIEIDDNLTNDQIETIIEYLEII